jgi:hypothetical protein
MNNQVTDHMRLWLSLPDNTEKVHISMKDGMGQFDVNQRILKGTVSFGAGFEMPFFCCSLSGMELGPAGPTVTEMVLTTFRHGERWLSTLTPGRQPNFLPQYSIEIPFQLILDIVAGKPFALDMHGPNCSCGKKHDDLGAN